MKLTYEATIKFTVIHDIEQIDSNIKSDQEYAEEICRLICDESSVTDAVCCYEIMETSIDCR